MSPSSFDALLFRNKAWEGGIIANLFLHISLYRLLYGYVSIALYGYIGYMASRGEVKTLLAVPKKLGDLTHEYLLLGA